MNFAAVIRIHDEITAARNGGASVLLISEDLDKVFELADRVLLMFEGRLAFETRPGPEARGPVGRAMAGMAAPAVAPADA